MLQQTAKNGWALSNPEKYSLEHYIIADRGNLEIKYNDTTISIPYSKQIKRYRNSLSIYYLLEFLFVFFLPTQDISSVKIIGKIGALNSNIFLRSIIGTSSFGSQNL